MSASNILFLTKNLTKRGALLFIPRTGSHLFTYRLLIFLCNFRYERPLGYITCIISSCEDKKVEIEDSDFTPFLVEDLNPNSSTYGKEVGPSFYFGKVAAYYFGDPG